MEIDELLLLATIARGNDEFDEAKTLVKRALAINPHHAGAAAVLCSILRTQGRPDEALYATLPFLRAPSSALLVSRAAACCDLRSWERAKHELDRALSREGGPAAFTVLRRIRSARPELYVDLSDAEHR